MATAAEPSNRLVSPLASATQEPSYWNFTKSAELLGSLSSILAAFAFGALVIMLATPPKDSGVDVAPAEQLMIGSFFSLIVASFLFAVQSGSGSAVRRYRPFVEGFCSCWILAISTVELCACTAWLLSVYRVPAGVLPIGNGIVLGAIGITSLSLTGVAMAPAFQRTLGLGLTIKWLAISMLPIVLSIPVGLWLLPSGSFLSLQWTVGASVVFTLLMALGYGVVNSFREESIKAVFYESRFGFVMFLTPILALACLFAAFIHFLPSVQA